MGYKHPEKCLKAASDPWDGDGIGPDLLRGVMGRGNLSLMCFVLQGKTLEGPGNVHQWDDFIFILNIFPPCHQPATSLLPAPARIEDKPIPAALSGR